jgi:nucleoside-diphosphate-sugar epimerase
MYVDDCVEGTVRVASGENALPVDVGSSQRYASIKMVDMIERIAGIAIRRN